MFDRVAGVYDLMNTAMTAGMHHRWRQRAAERAELGPGDGALDVCCGTGDLAIELAARVGPQGTVVTNPAFGATYGLKLGRDFRLGFFLGLTAPVGMGGGDKPNPDAAAVIKLGVPARSAMDNAMFAVNDFTVFPGVGSVG